ncbi:MAG: DUF5666 domain-containing protein [Myxococcota bacterium]
MQSSWALPLVTVLVLLVGPVFAQEPCAGPTPFVALALGGDESGIGGTGLSGADGGLGGTYLGGEDSGIGGTGRSGEDSGIGGTGRGDDESGIGGTGIFGTVTAFGSLCVNSLRVQYDENVEVEINGARASSADLAVGQVVYAVAHRHDGRLVAGRIEVWSAAVGVVEEGVRRRTSGGGMRFRVGDREVSAQPATELVGGDLEDLHAGRHVDVSGLPTDDGTIVASRIVFVDSGARVPQHIPSLRELVSRSAVGRVSVESYLAGTLERPELGGLRVELPESTALPERVRPGVRVRAMGRIVRPGVLRVDRPERPDRPTLSDRPLRPGDGKKPDRAPEPIRVERLEKPGRPERPATVDRPQILDRPVIVDRPEILDRPGIVDRPDVPDRPVIVDRPEVLDRPVIGDRPEVLERPESSLRR